MTPEEAVGKAAREALQLIEQVRLQADVEVPFTDKRVLATLEAVTLEMSHVASHALASLAEASQEGHPDAPKVTQEAKDCAREALLRAAAATTALWAMSKWAQDQPPEALH